MRGMKSFIIYSYFAVLLLLSGLTESLGKTEIRSDYAKDDKLAISPKVKQFELTDVRLTGGTFKKAMELNAEWLLSLEPDRFLAWFRKEAGLEPKGEVYGGWESETIAGHSLGHYMSAIAMMYAQGGGDEFKRRCDYIVDELAAVQEANGSGYMSAFPNGKKVFEEIRRGEIRSQGFDLNGIWVPWYTQHKLMAGLRDIYHYTHNEKALEVYKRHADWICEVTANLTDEQWQKMLACEHGGINEVLADLYGITGEAKYLGLAKKFYHKKVLEPLSNRENCLTGLHANTQVPKVIGSARIYELTGDEKFKTIADFFWETVVNHYTYANGGNSAEEYFGKPGHLAELMHDTTETCNTYNMMKLTKHLYGWEPKAEYMDYYERAMLNHILTHQHPEHGGRLVYKGFLDMPAQKGYSSPDESFWCCVGTGMENHCKYAGTVYAYYGDDLYVNLFVSSELDWKDKGVTVTQESELPNEGVTVLKFGCKEPVEINLKIRIPQWAKSVNILVNGEVQLFNVEPDYGYMFIEREFSDNDVVALVIPLKYEVSRLPDMENRVAIFYGPSMLAALLEDGEKPAMLVCDDTDDLLGSIKRVGLLEFAIEDKAYRLGDGGWENTSLKLVPLYAVAEQPYTVYMDTYTPGQWQEKQVEYAAEQKRLEQIEAATVDVLAVGQMQAERDHNLDGKDTSVGNFNGRKFRHTYNGWFEFDMKVDGAMPMDLIFSYWGSERGKRMFDILVDGTKIATQELNRNNPNEFFDVVYSIPEELTKGKDKVRVRIAAHENNYAGGLFGARAVIRE